MAKKNLPNIPLYIGDWQKDCNVLSLESEGAWLRIVFKLWTKGNASEYNIHIKSLCNLWGSTIEKANVIINELIDNNICKIEMSGEFVLFTKNNLSSRSTIVYVVKLSNNIEDLIKIGITSKESSIYRRYSYHGYNKIEIIKTYNFKNRALAAAKEKSYHNRFSSYKYEPKIKFGGYTECFNTKIISEL